MLWRQGGGEARANRTSNQPAIERNVAFDRREEMIRMRDGVRLHTLIFIPRVHETALPFLMLRSPYGVGEYTSDAINREYRELVADGYIFVVQDIRGRHGSEGRFMMNRPPHDKSDPKGS
jgi:predicted acyl esterase